MGFAPGGSCASRARGKAPQHSYYVTVSVCVTVTQQDVRWGSGMFLSSKDLGPAVGVASSQSCNAMCAVPYFKHAFPFVVLIWRQRLRAARSLGARVA